MNDEKKRTVGESLAEIIKAGGKVSDWAIVEKLISPSDEVLPYVTEINAPVEMSLCDRMVVRDLEHGVTARRDFIHAVRVNMIPFKRKRSEEVIQSWVAVSLQNLWKEDKLKDKLFGDERR